MTQTFSIVARITCLMAASLSGPDVMAYEHSVVLWCMLITWDDVCDAGRLGHVDEGDAGQQQ